MTITGTVMLSRTFSTSCIRIVLLTYLFCIFACIKFWFGFVQCPVSSQCLRLFTFSSPFSDSFSLVIVSTPDALRRSRTPPCGRCFDNFGMFHVLIWTFPSHQAPNCVDDISCHGALGILWNGTIYDTTLKFRIYTTRSPIYSRRL